MVRLGLVRRIIEDFLDDLCDEIPTLMTKVDENNVEIGADVTKIKQLIFMIFDDLNIPGRVGNLKDFINQVEKVFNLIIARLEQLLSRSGNSAPIGEIVNQYGAGIWTALWNSPEE